MEEGHMEVVVLMGGGGSSGRSSTYRPGYTRYLYYKNNRPHYFYSRTRISPGGVEKAKFRAIVMAIALIAFYSIFFVPILKSVVHNPKKLTMDYQKQDICIVDNLHILDDVEIDNLYNEMEDFQFLYVREMGFSFRCYQDIA